MEAKEENGVLTKLDPNEKETVGIINVVLIKSNRKSKDGNNKKLKLFLFSLKNKNILNKKRMEK